MKIRILDGAFGTLAQEYRLPEEAYVLDGKTARGCNDVLCLTRPDVVADIHRRYVEAGADIITTNSFNANAISLSDYGLEHRAYDLARRAAEIAKATGRFVAGSMGPTNRTLSMSPDVSRPGYREIDYEQLRDAYRVQAQGLIDGGADALLIETVFDTLNAKAAISAIRDISPDFPIMISGTLTDASGRTLSGQTVEAFCASVAHARPVSIGLNCGFGAKHLLPYLRRLRAVAPCAVSVHPNAGLPNMSGGYDETPEMFAADMGAYLREGLADIVGGCCGTTPEHIAALKEVAEEIRPEVVSHTAPSRTLTLAGLEPLRVVREANLINIGERANVAGSAKFAKMIREGDYAGAVSVARAQVDAGAQILDICLDDGMIDGVAAMSEFLNLIAAEPEIARVPVMIDSSDWQTIEAGLQRVQGKSIVNSISLKEGEEVFLKRARAVMGYGAAGVVMLFDEQGQADTYERKIAVAQRAYDLLSGIGFPKEDIIFDPNVLAIATGMPEHDAYARDFIEATRWIKSNLPGAKVSGGVSNLSFAFRGNNVVRKAMHSVFLYHAAAAGMDMAILNPQMVTLFDDIAPDLLERVEDAVLFRRADAADRLAELARQLAAHNTEERSERQEAKQEVMPLSERIARAMLTGNADAVGADAVEALRERGSAIAVINDLLMPAMERVGQLFGEGKMFLPQVVKSARVMKVAVDAIFAAEPAEAGAEARTHGSIVLATVKGDVHDIGKNIVAVVLACNGFKVLDLGVMVDAQQIIDKAKETGADAIGLSGLITPSLGEMIDVARQADRQGLHIPIIIGGATTSPLHTAVKIAPVTSAPVIHARDAADTARILAALCGDDRADFLSQNASTQARERSRSEGRAAGASVQRRTSSHNQAVKRMRLADIGLADLVPAINWAYFFSGWGMPGKAPEIFDHPDKGEEARKLYTDARAMLKEIVDNGRLELRAASQTFDAYAEGDDIVLSDGRRLAMTRSADGQCVADFVDGKVTLFALSAAFGLDKLVEEYDGDDYKRIMAKLLADRLTEAYAQVAFPGGCRFAFGYPSVPDHSLKRDVFDILSVPEKIGMRLTETCMIIPGESICGLWLPRGHYFQARSED